MTSCCPSPPHWPIRPWQPPVHPQYATVQPFAYRDTLNLMTWVQAIQCNLEQLRQTYNGTIDQMSHDNNEWDAAFAEAMNDMAQALADLEARLRSEMPSFATGKVWSPVYGREDSVQKALDDLYDNVRVHAIFSKDYDEMGLEAQEYDALGMTARGYDLFATDIIDEQLGAFTDGRGHFPPRNPIGNGIGDADPDYWVSREEAEATYMHRNPQAVEFERSTP